MKKIKKYTPGVLRITHILLISFIWHSVHNDDALVASLKKKYSKEKLCSVLIR